MVRVVAVDENWVTRGGLKARIESSEYWAGMAIAFFYAAPIRFATCNYGVFPGSTALSPMLINEDACTVRRVLAIGAPA